MARDLRAEDATVPGSAGPAADPDRTDPGGPTFDTEPSAPKVSTDTTADTDRTDPGGLIPDGARERDALVDVLRGLQQGQGRVWAPKPKRTASSDGADYAAHDGVHHAATRHDTPALAPKLVLEGAGAASPNEPTRPAVRARRAPAEDEPTRVMQPAARHPWRVFGPALGIVLLVGGLLAWRLVVRSPSMESVPAASTPTSSAHIATTAPPEADPVTPPPTPVPLPTSTSRPTPTSSAATTASVGAPPRLTVVEPSSVTPALHRSPAAAASTPPSAPTAATVPPPATTTKYNRFLEEEKK